MSGLKMSDKRQTDRTRFTLLRGFYCKTKQLEYFESYQRTGRFSRIMKGYTFVWRILDW